ARVLVGACVEEGDDVARLDLGKMGVRDEDVEVAALADEVSSELEGSISLARHDHRPAVVLEDPVREKNLGRVRLDPDEVVLPLDMAHGGEVDARIGEEAAARL